MKYLVTAILQVEYQVEVEAKDEESAIARLDKWIDDDFEPYQTDANWTLEAREKK